MSRKNENVAALLQQKFESVVKASDTITAITNDWQVIKNFLANRLSLDNLTPTQQLKLERYNFIYSHLLSSKYSKQEVLNMTMKFFNIQQSQVYEDYSCTQEIFSSVVQINKLFELQIELESAKELKRKAAIAYDWKAAATFQRNIIELQKMIPEKEETPGEFFEGHVYEPVFDPRLLGAPQIDMKLILESINAKRKVPIKTDMFEDLTPNNG